MAPFFFQLGFCNISQISLYLTSFFSCCFFAAWILLLKGKSQSFPRSSVRYEIPLAAFHIELKVGEWQHFHLPLLSPHTELQAQLEPSSPTTTSCKSSSTTTTTTTTTKTTTTATTIKSRFAKIIPSNRFVKDHSRKLVQKCIFFSTREIKYVQKLVPLRYMFHFQVLPHWGTSFECCHMFINILIWLIWKYCLKRFIKVIDDWSNIIVFIWFFLFCVVGKVEDL